jgi:hypothetical protein
MSVTTSEVEKVIEMALINTAEHVRASQPATFELIVKITYFICLLFFPSKTRTLFFESRARKAKAKAKANVLYV